jgi:hypothetical protein
MARPVLRVIFSNIIGFIMFLILLAIANLLVPHIPSSVYESIVDFFNSNILLFFGMMLVGMINEIFWSFFFPFNILAPITSAILSIFIVTFIYRVWTFIDSYVRTNIVLPNYVYVPIALIVLFLSYIAILIRQGKPKEVYEEEAKKPVPKKSEIIKRKPDEKVEWEDVSNEFKLALYNIGRSINKSFESSKEKKRKKKKGK